MNLVNIKVGQEFKNYKELCGVLEEDVCIGGNAKAKQQKEWNRHFEFAREKNAYIVTVIYPQPLVQLSSSDKTKYQCTLDMLLLDYLSKNESVVLTKKDCYKIFGFCNQDYLNDASIQEWNNSQEGCMKAVVTEIMRVNNVKFSEVLTRSLSRLSRQKLIYYRPTMNVVDYDNSVREATDCEMEQIRQIQRDVLLEYGYHSIDIIYLRGLQHQYYDTCNERIEKKLQLKHSYECLRMYYNPEEIKRELASNTYTQLREEFNAYLVSALGTKHKTEEKRHYNIINRQKSKIHIGTQRSLEEQYKSACYPENYIDIADNFNSTFIKLKPKE